MVQLRDFNKFCDIILEDDSYSDEKWNEIKEKAYGQLEEKYKIPRNFWKRNSNYWEKKQMEEYHKPIKKQLKIVILNIIVLLHGTFLYSKTRENDKLRWLDQLNLVKEKYELFQLLLIAHEKREDNELFVNIKKYFPHFDEVEMKDQHTVIHDKFIEIENIFMDLMNLKNIKNNCELLLKQMLSLNYLMNYHFCYEEIIITCYALEKPDCYNWNISKL